MHENVSTTFDYVTVVQLMSISFPSNSEIPRGPATEIFIDTTKSHVLLYRSGTHSGTNMQGSQ